MKRSATLCVVVLPIILLAAYTLAYLGLSERVDMMPLAGSDARAFRDFRYSWEAELFKPAAGIESTILQRQVGTGYTTP
jgi:hypothetical protein